MHLDLSDDETAALLRELDNIIEGDRYPLSPRILTLKAIRAKLRLEPVREPEPPRKRYEPPRNRPNRRRARRRGAVPASPSRKLAIIGRLTHCERKSFIY